MCMIFRVKMSKKTGHVLENIRKASGFPANTISRIAIALSLKHNSAGKDEIIKAYESYDSEGIEIQRHVLLGEYEAVYRSLMEKFCGSPLSDEEFFPVHVKYHIESGIDFLSDEYKLAGNMDRLIKALINEV